MAEEKRYAATLNFEARGENSGESRGSDHGDVMFDAKFTWHNLKYTDLLVVESAATKAVDAMQVELLAAGVVSAEQKGLISAEEGRAILQRDMQAVAGRDRDVDRSDDKRRRDRE